jgi:hypothetical protein
MAIYILVILRKEPLMMRLSFRFRILCHMIFYPILLCSFICNPIEFSSIQFFVIYYYNKHSIRIYSIPFNSTAFHYILFHSIEVCSVQSIRLNFTCILFLLDSIILTFHSNLFYSIQFHCTHYILFNSIEVCSFKSILSILIYSIQFHFILVYAAPLIYSIHFILFRCILRILFNSIVFYFI